MVELVCPSPTLSKAPTQPQETTCILHSLNQMQSRINELVRGVDRLEKGLCRLERVIGIAVGRILAVGVVWIVVNLLLLSFDITITPKP